MNRFCIMGLLLVFLLFSCVSGSDSETQEQAREEHSLSESDRILQVLRAGNASFALSNVSELPSMASVYSCSDMKVSPETLFQTSAGELFVISHAGYIMDEEIAGSLEAGFVECHTDVFILLAHKECVYVKHAIDLYYGKGHPVEGLFAFMLEKAFPVIDKIREENPGIEGEELVPYVTIELIWSSVKDLFSMSSVIREVYYNGELRVLAAVFDPESGEVLWLPEGSIKDLYNQAVLESQS